MNIQLISFSSRPLLMVTSLNRTTVHFLLNGIFNWTRLLENSLLDSQRLQFAHLLLLMQFYRLQEHNLQHKSDHVGREQCKYPFYVFLPDLNDIISSILGLIIAKNCLPLDGANLITPLPLGLLP